MWRPVSHSAICGFTLVEAIVAGAIILSIAAIVFPVMRFARIKAADSTCIENIKVIATGLSMYTSDYDGCFPASVETTFVNSNAASDQTWRDVISSYIARDNFPTCPLTGVSSSMRDSARPIDICGYAYNSRFDSVVRVASHSFTLYGNSDSQVAYATLTVSVLDARPGILSLFGPDVPRNSTEKHGIWSTSLYSEILSFAPACYRHRGGDNYVFVDNHAAWLLPKQLSLDAKCDGVHPGFGL